MPTPQHTNAPAPHPKACRAIRAAGPRSPILGYTSLPAALFQEEDVLECHDWRATERKDPADDGSWLSLFGLAANWLSD